MERREAPGACEAPWGGALRSAPPARRIPKTGLRVRSGGARVPQWRVCETRRPDAAPPGAPPPMPGLSGIGHLVLADATGGFRKAKLAECTRGFRGGDKFFSSRRTAEMK
jgi:hypothetical protein